MSDMQTRLLIIHNAAGGARVVLRTEAIPEPMPALARSLPVVDEDVRSVEPGPWAAGEPGCYACGFLWVAVWPLGDWSGDCLECPSCGTFSGKLPDKCWCIGCAGWSRTTLPSLRTPTPMSGCCPVRRSLELGGHLAAIPPVRRVQRAEQPIGQGVVAREADGYLDILLVDDAAHRPPRLRRGASSGSVQRSVEVSTVVAPAGARSCPDPAAGPDIPSAAAGATRPPSKPRAAGASSATPAGQGMPRPRHASARTKRSVSDSLGMRVPPSERRRASHALPSLEVSFDMITRSRRSPAGALGRPMAICRQPRSPKPAKQARRLW